jgi:hypothetical protein
MKGREAWPVFMPEIPCGFAQRTFVPEFKERLLTDK